MPFKGNYWLVDWLIDWLFTVDGDIDDEDLNDESGTTPRVDSHMRFIETNGPSAHKEKGTTLNFTIN